MEMIDAVLLLKTNEFLVTASSQSGYLSAQTRGGSTKHILAVPELLGTFLLRGHLPADLDFSSKAAF